MNAREVEGFRRTVLEFYATNGRHNLPWRQLSSDRSQRFYEVWVSEMMLQQTGVGRVIEKYGEWMSAFPDLSSVANARLGEIIRRWQGLGYNRRAGFVHQTANELTKAETLPVGNEDLVRLPGVGANTAAAILCYTDNSRQTFIETNIRTVYIHHFFKDEDKVTDAQIKESVEAALPRENFREWYWALMDYGSFLKKSGDSQLKKAAGHKPQSKFEGSLRQIRGKVLKNLSIRDADMSTLRKEIADDRLEQVLGDLIGEGLITLDATTYRLP